MLHQKVDIDTAADAGATPVLRIAVCGEVSAGKSTVLNTLLRARVLPDNIGKTTRPVVTVGHRAEAGVEVEHSDGRCSVAETVATPGLFEDAAHVRLWSDLEHLSGFEIIEVPMTKAEELTEEQVALVRSADVMVWVTIASQAWRLTEKTIVEQLGEDRPAHAVLAVTRADKLRNDRDRSRLKERMVRETADYFGDVVFINGARAKLGKAAKSPKAWAETGGAVILEALEACAARVRAERDGESEEPESAAPEDEAAGRAEVVDLADFREAPAPTDDEDKPAAAVDAPVSEAEPEAEVTASAPAAPRAAAPLGAGLPGVVVLGLRPEEDGAPFEVMQGNAEMGGVVSDLCHGLREGLIRTAATAETGAVGALCMSMGDHRVLFEEVPGVGLLCLMAQAPVMSQGIAQSMLSRIARSLAAAG